MTENTKIRTAQATHDGHLAAHGVPHRGETVENKPVSRDERGDPNNMDRDVTTSIDQVKLICPRCGESTLRAEFPDQYEAWVRCSSCSFFMGMSNDDWHRMKNSPNIHEKIRKMAIKKDLLKE